MDCFILKLIRWHWDSIPHITINSLINRSISREPKYVQKCKKSSPRKHLRTRNRTEKTTYSPNVKNPDTHTDLRLMTNLTETSGGNNWTRRTEATPILLTEYSSIPNTQLKPFQQCKYVQVNACECLSLNKCKCHPLLTRFIPVFYPIN